MTEADMGFADQPGQPGRARRNLADPAHDWRQAQAGGQEGQRQAHRQHAEGQRPGQGGRFPHQGRMGAKTDGCDADHAAGAGRKAAQRGQQAESPSQGHGADGPGDQAPYGVFQRLAAQGACAPHQQGGEERQRRPAENLQQQIGRHSTQRPQPVGDIAQIGIAQAGVVGGIGHQRQHRRRRRQHQDQARAAHRQDACQPVHGVLGVGQCVTHDAAPGAGMINTADHATLCHLRCPWD